MKRGLILIFFLLGSTLFSQTNPNSERINPTNWWIGMKNNHVQVILRSNQVNFNQQKPKIDYAGVTLKSVHTFPNTSYIAIDLVISNETKPGIVKIKVGKSVFDFPLTHKKTNSQNRRYAQGVTSKDFMYLIMPDRFSNGDPSNDRVVGMLDQSLRRDTVFNRHGGDLQGVINHLDYLHELGVTAIWLNPVLENDMPSRTEHGYAITDHYRVDPRLGGNALYKKLVSAAHDKGIKVIQDAIYNHVGIKHWMVQDPPDKDWLHQWKNYTNTTYKDQVLFDPYVSKIDEQEMSDGWFTPEMPDLNQSNPFIVKFLIQHAIWCVEEFGIDGWRIDTYAYNDLKFMNSCNQALYDEYPNITLFGETYVHGVVNQSFFAKNNFEIPFKSNLQGVTDFQLLWGINDAMTKPFGWTDGVNKLYTNLASDFVYTDPYKNVIFLDNHDLSRVYSVYNKNIDKLKSALGWLLTCRGIPQLYYGTEVLMEGFTSPNDGYVRQDFPGGWQNDAINKFTPKDRSDIEQEVWNYIATLANYRKTSNALTIGKLTQFVPVDGVYVYFRSSGDETIMCVMNTMDTEKECSLGRFTEMTSWYTQGQEIISHKIFNLKDLKWNLEPHSFLVLKLQK